MRSGRCEAHTALSGRLAAVHGDFREAQAGIAPGAFGLVVNRPSDVSAAAIASAIVPVIIGEDTKTFIFWRELFDAGVFVNAFISPGVPPGMAMLRTSYMATHEDHHLDRILETFCTIGKKLGVIQ